MPRLHSMAVAVENMDVIAVLRRLMEDGAGIQFDGAKVTITALEVPPEAKALLKPKALTAALRSAPVDIIAPSQRASVYQPVVIHYKPDDLGTTPKYVSDYHYLLRRH